MSALDVERGLHFTLDKPQLFLKLLRGFLDDQATLPDDLRSTLVDGDRVQAERIVHTARGISSSLGAVPLADAAESVERALREGRAGPDLDALVDVLADEHAAVFGPLATWFGVTPARIDARRTEVDPSPSSPPSPPGPVVRAILEQIAGRVADDDADALDLFEVEEATLQATWEAGTATLGRALRTYAFDAATEILSSWLVSSQPSTPSVSVRPTHETRAERES